MKIPAQSAPVARGKTAPAWRNPPPSAVGPTFGCNRPWWNCYCSVTGTAICCDPLETKCPPNGAGGCSCA